MNTLFKILLVGAFATTMFIVAQGCNKKHPSCDLRVAQHDLWNDHMHYTYATVDAYFNNSAYVGPNYNRLIKNQKDIGASIRKYYGTEAADSLTALLTEHIELALPVLDAVKSGDQVKLNIAMDNWYKNAKEVADFLADANPDYLYRDEIRAHMKEHIATTALYAIDLHKKDYELAVFHFDEANHHMRMTADLISKALSRQFPDK